jgi:hypothetical protein
MDRKNNLTLSFDDYVGSGTIKVTGNNPQNGKPLTLTSSQPDAFDGFTGTFQCDVLNGVGAALRFGIDITNPTFGILLTETEEIQTGAGITGRYDLTNDVTVTSLKIKDYQDVAGEDVLVLDYTFAPGTYTLDTTANPGATDLSNVDGTGLDLSPHFVDGGGTITVDSGTAADPYGDWAADAGGNFLGTLTDSNPDLDFDGGGLETGIEWVVGGDPTDPSDDAGKAPTFDNTSDPDKFLFVYRRTDDANADANTSIAAQYGSDLMGWTNAVHQGTEPGDITITEDDDFFGAGIGRVTVAIPRSLAVDAKLFARLEVAVTTTP